MPNAPLPKPAAPVPPKPPQAAAQNSAPITQANAPVSSGVTNSAMPNSGAVFPPQSQFKGSLAPATNTPLTPAAPTSTMPAVARPGSPLPTNNQPPPPRPGVAPSQPPARTLTALQSMSSTQLPTAAGQTIPTPPNAGQRAGNPTMVSGQLPPPPAAGKTGASTDPKKPEFAEPSKSPLRFLPYIVGGLLLLGILGFVAFRMFGGGGTTTPTGNSNTTTNNGTNGTTGQPQNNTPTTPSVVLEYWGLWEPTETMQTVIKDYETANPGVSINFTKQSHQDYRLRLKTALAQGGNGPDIFRYHSSWVPMMSQELSPLPSAVMTSSEFTSTFYPAAAQLLQVGGNIVGIPLMYDGLALYYNTEIFSTAVVDPPKTWSDLRALASKLTVKANASITRAGVAMGNTSNVEHFSDIIAVLMMQNGADMTKPNSPQTRDALLFYTNFIKSDGVWNDSLPLSSVAFARGDVAMMFAPSWRALEVKQMNPNLKFKVVPLPQLSDSRIAYANFWAEGVSSKSTHKEEAWKFLKYLSSSDVQKKLYSAQSQVRPFGEIYSRKDLANTLAEDDIASAYLQDAPYAKGWYMSSNTHDDGLNDQIIKYYEDAVNSLLKGDSIEDVLITLDQGVQQVLTQYGVTSTGGTAPASQSSAL